MSGSALCVTDSGSPLDCLSNGLGGNERAIGGQMACHCLTRLEKSTFTDYAGDNTRS